MLLTRIYDLRMGEGSHDKAVEEAVQLFVDLNTEAKDRVRKWHEIQYDAQVRNIVGA